MNKLITIIGAFIIASSVSAASPFISPADSPLDSVAHSPFKTPMHKPVAGGVVTFARIMFDEGTGTTISDSEGLIPSFNVLGTTSGLWANANRITYHSGGNGHARIVLNSTTDDLFKQDDLDGVGAMLIFFGINYPVEPATNQRVFQYGGKDPDPTTGGINLRINGAGLGGDTTFSMAVHPNSSIDPDLSLTSSAVSNGVDHTLAVILDWTTAGQVTATWYIDGVADTSTTVTQTAPTISPNSGTLRGLEIAGRPTNPPDSLLTSTQLWGLQFYKYYYDGVSDAVADIATLHADFTADLGY